MTFTVNVQAAPFGISFEVGSIEEAIGFLQEKKARWAELFDLSGEVTGGEATTVITNTPRAGESVEATAARTRKPRANKNQPDPATASAPPPMPVTPPAAPIPPTPGLEIPTFLDRSLQPAAAAAPAAPPPPPPLAVATPTMPVAPAPVGRLAPLVMAECKRRGEGAADGGKAIADWLSASGLCTSGSSFKEAIAVLQFATDAQLAGVAQGLQIA